MKDMELYDSFIRETNDLLGFDVLRLAVVEAEALADHVAMGASVGRIIDHRDRTLVARVDHRIDGFDLSDDTPCVKSSERKSDLRLASARLQDDLFVIEPSEDTLIFIPVVENQDDLRTLTAFS